MTQIHQDAKVEVPQAVHKSATTYTNQGADAIDGAKETSEQGVNLTIKSGPLPMVLYKALNVLYAKDTGRLANFALENHQEPTKDYVYCVIASEVTDEDIYQFGRLTSAAQEEQRRVILLVLPNESVPEANATRILRAIAKRTNSQMFDSLDALVAGETNV